jgi:hypothetical protein
MCFHYQGKQDADCEPVGPLAVKDTALTASRRYDNTISSSITNPDGERRGSPRNVGLHSFSHLLSLSPFCV